MAGCVWKWGFKYLDLINESLQRHWSSIIQFCEAGNSIFTSFSTILACSHWKCWTQLLKDCSFVHPLGKEEPQNTSQQKGIGSPSSTRSEWPFFSPNPAQWFQLCSKSHDLFSQLLDEKIRHSSVCLSVCLNFFFARKTAQILPNLLFYSACFPLLCLHFFFSATGIVRSWAIWLRFHISQETRDWRRPSGISVTDDSPVLIPTFSPLVPTYLASTLGTRKEKNSSVMKTSSCIFTRSGWEFAIYSILSVLFVMLLSRYFPSQNPK